ncbi:hypothetical protein DXG01_008883 [Tephrocybe rancida]|nr:hypothetical protein DXG01_008883 [Tephrocybe rancida]
MVKKLFKPVLRRTNIGSGYNSLLPGLAGDGIYLSLQNSAPSSPTPALPFENMSPDVFTIPHLMPSAYPLHFRVPPLGPGAFAAPEESAVGPAIAATFQYISTDATLLAPPCTNTGHKRYPAVQVEYSGNTQDPAYDMELSDDGSIAESYGEHNGDQLRPYVGNTADPAFRMELSDDEGQLACSTRLNLTPASLTSPEHIPQHPGIVPDEPITKSYPSNELDPAYEMDLSDNDWDPSAGLVLSDNEDVAADMELSNDEEA